jgi:shikimate kinase
MRIYLTGYMVSGKTHLGMQLSALLGYAFTDLDELFEAHFHISIPDFFSKYQEAGFRKLEAEVLRETGRMERTVIATGGGTPCFGDNMSWIRSSGRSVYLRLEPELLASRLLKVKKYRPVLSHVPDPELPEFVRKHLSEREFYYLQADIVYCPETQPLSWLIDRIPEPGTEPEGGVKSTG